MLTKWTVATAILLSAACTTAHNDKSNVADAESSSDQAIQAKLYDAPDHEPNETCDIHTMLTLDLSQSKATLVNQVSGICEIYVAPNERSYDLTEQSTTRCGETIYRGTLDGDAIEITDYRFMTCEILPIADIVVNETRDGATQRLYSNKVTSVPVQPPVAQPKLTGRFYSEPNVQPDESCDVHTALSLQLAGDLQAELKEVVGGFCELYVEPNLRSYDLIRYNDRCGRIIYRGYDGDDSIEITDFRSMTCEPVVIADMSIVEKRDGIERRLYSGVDTLKSIGNMSE